MGSLGRTLAGVVAWKLMTGLCIRRPAVITPCLSPLQKQISEMLDTMELENSHLSAHELREKIDTARLQQAQQKGKNTIRNTNLENALVTAHEQELLWQAENSKFRPAERVTEHDKTKNIRSAWRSLDHPLFLLVKQACENESPSWGLPAIPVQETHTLRQSADLLAEKYLPARAKCRIFGNAPSAVHVYRYRDAKSGQRFGVQIYFYNAYVDRVWHGENLNFPVSSSSSVDSTKADSDPSEYAWIRAHELGDYVQDRKMLRVLRSFMIEY